MIIITYSTLTYSILYSQNGRNITVGRIWPVDFFANPGFLNLTLWTYKVFLYISVYSFSLDKVRHLENIFSLFRLEIYINSNVMEILGESSGGNFGKMVKGKKILKILMELSSSWEIWRKKELNKCVNKWKRESRKREKQFGEARAGIIYGMLKKQTE